MKKMVDFRHFVNPTRYSSLEGGGSTSLNNVYYEGGLYGRFSSDNTDPGSEHHGNAGESHGMDCAV